MKQLRRDVWEFISKSKHKKCISSIPQSIRTPLGSPHQLRLGVVLRCLSLSPYNCGSLCTRIIYHIITTYCSTYRSAIVLEIEIT